MERSYWCATTNLQTTYCVCRRPEDSVKMHFKRHDAIWSMNRRRRRRRRMQSSVLRPLCIPVLTMLIIVLHDYLVVASKHIKVEAFQTSGTRFHTTRRADSFATTLARSGLRQPMTQQHLISMTSLLEDYADVLTGRTSNNVKTTHSNSSETLLESNGAMFHAITRRGPGGYSIQLVPSTSQQMDQKATTSAPQNLMHRLRHGIVRFFSHAHNNTGSETALTSQSIWRHRNARSTEEGIRHELTTPWTANDTTSKSNSIQRGHSARRLSSVLAKASVSIERTSRRMAARTLTGLITALAEEVVDLDVEVDARDDTPFYNKHITAVRIRFARLGFKPLRIGGHVTNSPQPQQRAVENQMLLNSFKGRSTQDRKLVGVTSWSDDDEYDDLMSLRKDEMELQTLTADEAFDRIDVDKSGYLDREELVQALSLAARTSTDNTILPQDVDSDSNLHILEKLASDLFELYDVNGDGVVDRKEYKTMVEDMAALRQVQELRERKQRSASDDEGDQSRWSDSAMAFLQNLTGGAIHSSVEFVQNKTSFLSDKMEFVQSKSSSVLSSGMEFFHSHTGWLPWRQNEMNVTFAQDEDFMGRSNGSVVRVVDSTEVVESVAKSLGSITFSDVKMDLRRLFFGAIPLLKRIVPGGPLILEPFTATITGSFDRHDIMNSVLLDAALRRLVMRALRRRVGFLRDFLEGAMFNGRSWKTFNGEGPKVDVPELTNVEFDANDKLIITGRARVSASPESPVIEQSFKVRTSIGTRKNGRFIRLEKPELALVIECPKDWEANIEKLCDALHIEKPQRLKPIYSFFPIYSPFKLEEDDGFDLGLDNAITSLVIKRGALRFEMSAVLRPGRFLGSHYIAFTVPIRTFIVTLDRVTEGIRAARKGKKAARVLQLAYERIAGNGPSETRRRSISFDTAEDALLARQEMRMKRASTSKNSKAMSFFSRFVDGYLQAERDDAKKERLTASIRDFFGRQSN